MNGNYDIQVRFSTDARRYAVTPDTAELRAIVDAIAHWRRLPELVTFALERHGYGDSDGGFGVTYQSDLDDYERSQGHKIMDGEVEIYGFWGPPDGHEFHVPETLYLLVLGKVLEILGLLDDAHRIEKLRGAISSNTKHG